MIFVGGIHGVGKTSFCKEVSLHFGMKWYSASSIIMNYKKKNSIEKNSKYVTDISTNQDVLMKFIMNVDGTDEYILDGHFCLLDSSGKITRIELDVFTTIRPKILIVIIDTPKNIQKKLLERDGVYYELKIIERFLNEEAEYAKEIERILNINLYFIKSNDDWINIFEMLLNSFNNHI